MKNEKELNSNEHDHVSCLRIHMQDLSPNEKPADLVHRFFPTTHIARAWIPQTLGDQVWCMFKFKSKKDRVEWEKTLNDELKGYLDRDLITYALEFGWHVRNYNGFYRD